MPLTDQPKPVTIRLLHAFPHAPRFSDICATLPEKYLGASGLIELVSASGFFLTTFSPWVYLLMGVRGPSSHCFCYCSHILLHIVCSCCSIVVNNTLFTMVFKIGCSHLESYTFTALLPITVFSGKHNRNLLADGGIVVLGGGMRYSRSADSRFPGSGHTTQYI